jgi:hypothetical protein
LKVVAHQAECWRIVDELHYKGWSVKIADWLHLSNPDDPSRPVVAHFVYGDRKHARGKPRAKVRRQTVMVVGNGMTPLFYGDLYCSRLVRQTNRDSRSDVDGHH